jgi:glycosyltransferase involved in cell wall biosynthesis
LSNAGPRHILCLHQGYELYGSDRSFIQCVDILCRNFPDAKVTVVVPHNGPIMESLSALRCEVVFDPMWIIRKRGLAFRVTLGLPGLFAAIARARRRIAAADLVYINTAVVADYYLAARGFARKVIGHVREIPTGKAMTVIGRMIGFSRAAIIFNSQATSDAFELPVGQPNFVLHNSFTGPARPKQSNYDGSRPLRLLMIGRINSWKGQDLLLNALTNLTTETRRRVEVRIVGSTFENQPFDAALEEYVIANGLSEQVVFLPFTKDPTDQFEWSDIVVVPSRLPEPFGRVAIEAQAFARPVMAAAHGGLLEIVTDGQDGWLFAPNDASGLAACIAEAAESPHKVTKLGESARETYLNHFTVEAMEKGFLDIIEEVTSQSLTLHKEPA